ncbi:MAG TPA: hypothetical protein VNN80_05040 [Polyangiaceae bacterium]|nr:hypothetical protein [Polyangiaceae bacterium]
MLGAAQRRDEAARRGRGVVARGDHEAAADIYARLAPFKSEAVSFDAVLRRLGGQAER